MYKKDQRVIVQLIDKIISLVALKPLHCDKLGIFIE